jgi:hypothetical protein
MTAFLLDDLGERMQAYPLINIYMQLYWASDVYQVYVF